MTEISAKQVSAILPSDVKLKEKLNPECLKEGHFCGSWRKIDTCIIPVFQTDSEGNTTLVKLTPCKKTGLKGFDVYG